MTHAAARLGNAITPPFVIALIAAISWRGSFVVTGVVSIVWVLIWGFYYRDDPRAHPGVRPEDHASLPPPRPPAARTRTPWGPLLRRMAPVTFVYFCYGWTLWTFLSWVPQFMLHAYKLDLKNSALFSSVVFFGGVLGDALGGLLSDFDLPPDRQPAAGAAGSGRVRRWSAPSCAPRRSCSSPTRCWRRCSLGGAFFFAEMTIGPMWAIPMDIAPRFSGTASGIMNTGSALAAIISPVVFGVVIDRTGNWSLPFYGTMALLAVGCVAAFTMRPDRTFAADPAAPETLELA